MPPAQLQLVLQMQLWFVIITVMNISNQTEHAVTTKYLSLVMIKNDLRGAQNAALHVIFATPFARP